MQILNVEECFTGEFTGSINTTRLRQWLQEIKRKPILSAFAKENAQQLIDAHEWDATFETRIISLGNMKTFTPLIGVLAPSKGVYIIDGWHRLWLLNEAAKRMPHIDHVPFPMYAVTLEECRKFPPPKSKEGVKYENIIDRLSGMPAVEGAELMKQLFNPLRGRHVGYIGEENRAQTGSVAQEEQDKVEEEGIRGSSG